LGWTGGRLTYVVCLCRNVCTAIPGTVFGVCGDVCLSPDTHSSLIKNQASPPLPTPKAVDLRTSRSGCEDYVASSMTPCNLVDLY
jgi:hypothetical protein